MKSKLVEKEITADLESTDMWLWDEQWRLFSTTITSYITQNVLIKRLKVKGYSARLRWYIHQKRLRKVYQNLRGFPIHRHHCFRCHVMLCFQTASTLLSWQHFDLQLRADFEDSETKDWKRIPWNQFELQVLTVILL